MKLFNSFQVTAAFAAWPFGIAWLQDASFRGSQAAFYAACALYVVAFGAMVVCVRNNIDEA